MAITSMPYATLNNNSFDNSQCVFPYRQNRSSGKEQRVDTWKDNGDAFARRSRMAIRDYSSLPWARS
ncbi:hypothetical protein RvY_14788 [Ramazzottius varieornatus]|uniref:Uncharacterized protein n=1 Tax=Ramazzottius varieornatus TaxID=947166 RepID=A0A1D1W0V4_RAMVA|nr:hypothetical protein RvY_14788 [Ramazzottius varieornatus]